jgi:toluene monooxygenase electron transfer component
MPLVAIRGTDISWTCKPGDTIMRAALRAGLGFPYECNVGSCGNCRFDLIEGEIEELRQDPPGLQERDRARGRRLGCQSAPLGDCIIKARLMPQYQNRFRPQITSARLIETRDITHDIREFRFQLERPQPFQAGQYALLSVPGVNGQRAYSMANTGETGGQWHFQIKRVPGGGATGALFDRVSTGNEIIVDGPYGMAWLREDAPRDIVCIAGGSGLSPMISIARTFAASPQLKGRRLDFIYGGRAARDICGAEMLEALPGFGQTLFYHPAVSSETESWDGYRGFVHDVASELFGVHLADREIYFAGPPMMGEAMQKMLLAHGVPPEQIHFDQFY